MASGITKTDGMFSVRQVPWHGLGVVLDDLATGKEAVAAAGMNWNVLLQPLGFLVPGTDNTYIEVPDKYATVRSDNNALLGTVGGRYTPLQNIEAVEIMDAVTQDPGGPKYTTGGSLWGGKTTWFLLEFPDSLRFMSPKDPTKDYLLLWNSHDGSSAVSVAFTQTRVVCQNTLNFAKSKMTKGGIFRAKHTKNIMGKVSDIQNFLGIVQEDRITVADALAEMQKYNPTMDEVNDVLSQLFDKRDNTSEYEDESTRTKHIKEEVIGLFHGDANRATGDVDSFYALLNGITEYANVSTIRAQDKINQRLDSTWFGDSADLNAKAFDLIAGCIR